MVKEKVKLVCKRCKSERIVHHGFNTTVKDGRKQRYKCQNCGHTFYDDNEVK